MRICPNCGYEVVNDAAKFCRKCGNPLPPLTPVIEEQPDELEDIAREDNALTEDTQPLEETMPVETHTTETDNVFEGVSQPEMSQPSADLYEDSGLNGSLPGETTTEDPQDTIAQPGNEEPEYEYAAQAPYGNQVNKPKAKLPTLFIVLTLVGVVVFSSLIGLIIGLEADDSGYSNEIDWGEGYGYDSTAIDSIAYVEPYDDYAEYDTVASAVEVDSYDSYDYSDIICDDSDLDDIDDYDYTSYY